MGLRTVLCGENALRTRVGELAMIEDEMLKWRFRRGSREASLRRTGVPARLSGKVAVAVCGIFPKKTQKSIITASSSRAII